jgi:hemerythrin
LADSQGRWSESVAEHYYMFLSTWAIDHVIEDDMKMKPLLETYPYDFKPDNLKD